jgi:hypothetical protein
MLPFLSYDQIKDFKVSRPTFDAGTERYLWESRKLSEVITPLAAGFLDLKRIFNVTEIRYRLKWRRFDNEHGTETTGQRDASVTGDEFEIVNANFLQFLGADAAQAVSLPAGDLPSDPEKVTKASLIAGIAPTVPLFLFANNDFLRTTWPLSNFDADDVRYLHNALAPSNAPFTSSVNAVDAPIFAGLRQGAHSALRSFRAENFANEFLYAPLDQPNTDMAAENSDETTYTTSDGISNYEVGFFGEVTLVYREFWQVVFDG